MAQQSSLSATMCPVHSSEMRMKGLPDCWSVQESELPHSGLAQPELSGEELRQSSTSIFLERLDPRRRFWARLGLRKLLDGFLELSSLSLQPT
jgi:hypothetical protein